MNLNDTLAKIIAPAAIVLALLVGSTPTAPESAPKAAPISTTQESSLSALVSGGCIRFTADGPRWHVNTAHHTIGLIDTSVQPFINASGWLEFKLTENGQPNPHPIVSMTVASDETLTNAGIFGGASSGTTEVRVRFWKAGVNGADGTHLNLNNPVHYDRISGDTSNVWITLVHDVAE